VVLVQFVVTVRDRDRFARTFDDWRDRMEADGAKDPQLYWNENEPNQVSMMAWWESHDAMMESSDRTGDQFQEEAGTVGLDWDTYIWTEFE
jgi:hypothetical protein